MKKTLIIFLIALSCNQESDSIKLGQQAIRNLSENYKNSGFIDNQDEYKYCQSIINNYNIEVQLWTKSEQRTIVFINGNESYAIPILSSEYMDYWNFQLEDTQNGPYGKSVYTTFMDEFIKMLHNLHIKDTLNITGLLLFNTFKIIDARTIYESDSTDIIRRIYFNNGSFTYENDSICSLRKVEIIKTVYMGIHKKGQNSSYFNAYWDERNGIIYQIDYDSIIINKSFKPNLKTYRLGCCIEPLIM